MLLGVVAPHTVSFASPAASVLVVVAGLLVGVGTQLGNGCTSGHGVCGVSRLSPRSLVATGTFMAAGVLAATLARVMAGAIAVHVAFARRAVRRPTTLRGDPVALPEATRIDARLVGGAVLFGLGWGAAGFCPGPALVAAVGGLQSSALLFVAAMLVGMVAFHRVARR